MVTTDAMRYQLEATAYQLDNVLEGLEGDQWDAKVREDLMSPREVVGHLIECYIAAQKHATGEKHDWGSYLPPSDDAEELVTEMRSERAKACEALLAKGDDDSLRAATDYIVLHDAYHVGQLAALRLGLDPDWDPYSIYKV